MGLAVLLKVDGLDVLATSKRVRQSEYLEMMASGQLLEKAKACAEELNNGANAAFEDQRRLGHAQGVAEGLAQAALERDQLRARASVELVAISARSGAMLQRLEDSIVRTVMCALEGLLEEIAPEKMYEAALRKVSKLLQAEPFLTLRVSPENESHAREALQRMKSESLLVGFVELKTDRTLVPFSAVIESEAGFVDASLDAQLDAIESTLRSEVARELHA